MEHQTDIEKLVTDFIYQKPEVVAKHLMACGYSLPFVLTLPVITKQAFIALFTDENEQFAQLMSDSINSTDFSNFVVVAVGLAISAYGMLKGAKEAKKAREQQKMLALAQMSQDKQLAEEQIRTGAETERTRILLQTLQAYRSDLQMQSTQRLKDVWIYIGIVAAGIGLLGGLTIILNPKNNG